MSQVNRSTFWEGVRSLFDWSPHLPVWAGPEVDARAMALASAQAMEQIRAKNVKTGH